MDIFLRTEQTSSIIRPQHVLVSEERVPIPVHRGNTLLIRGGAQSKVWSRIYFFFASLWNRLKHLCCCGFRRSLKPLPSSNFVQVFEQWIAPFYRKRDSQGLLAAMRKALWVRLFAKLNEEEGCAIECTPFELCVAASARNSEAAQSILKVCMPRGASFYKESCPIAREVLADACRLEDAWMVRDPFIDKEKLHIWKRVDHARVSQIRQEVKAFNEYTEQQEVKRFLTKTYDGYRALVQLLYKKEDEFPLLCIVLRDVKSELHIGGGLALPKGMRPTGAPKPRVRFE